jgi:hypothetical protein
MAICKYAGVVEEGSEISTRDVFLDIVSIDIFGIHYSNIPLPDKCSCHPGRSTKA